MNYWNQNAYLKIWNFASDVHQDQKTPSSDITI